MNTTSISVWFGRGLAGAAVALLMLCTGCNRDNVKVYHVENDDTVAPPTPPAPAAPAAPAAGNAANTVPSSVTPSTPQVNFTLPAGWQQTSPSEMRVASFTIPNTGGRPADVGVIPMPAGGQDLQLVNMWRQQMQLPATTEAEAEEIVEPVTIGDTSGKLFDIPSDAPLIDGKSRARILVAMMTQDQTSWFFKMDGEASFVEAQKPAFIQFLKSISLSAPATASTMDSGQLPPSHPAIPGLTMDGTTTPNPDTGSPKPVWSVPSGWQEAPLSEFLIAKYAVTGPGDTKAEVNVSALAGEGGGVLANVNRWRRQLGLDAVEDANLPKVVSSLDTGGNQAAMVDFTGTDAKTSQPARLVGVILPLGDQTWFYKLMGDPNLVAQQKDAFVKFIQSARYPDAAH